MGTPIHPAASPLYGQYGAQKPLPSHFLNEFARRALFPIVQVSVRNNLFAHKLFEDQLVLFLLKCRFKLHACTTFRPCSSSSAIRSTERSPCARLAVQLR